MRQACYRPQTKFAKVMFLQVSVCPQGGRVWLLWGWGMCGYSPGGVWLLPGGGGHAWLLWGAYVAKRGACMARGVAKGGMHGKGGHVWQRGACMARGACVAKGGVRGEGGRAWYARPVIARSVRILLECILVSRLILLCAKYG